MCNIIVEKIVMLKELLSQNIEVNRKVDFGRNIEDI